MWQVVGKGERSEGRQILKKSRRKVHKVSTKKHCSITNLLHIRNEFAMLNKSRRRKDLCRGTAAYLHIEATH